jgi:hypothetical protein
VIEGAGGTRYPATDEGLGFEVGRSGDEWKASWTVQHPATATQCRVVVRNAARPNDPIVSPLFPLEAR